MGSSSSRPQDSPRRSRVTVVACASLRRAVKFATTRRIRGPPRLSYDLLVEVMCHAAKLEAPDGLHTALRMMRTCRELYSVGAQVILRLVVLSRHALDLSELPPNLSSFILFLLAEDGSRLRFVRRISFYPIYHPDVIQTFGELLPQMTTLAELTLVKQALPIDPALDVLRYRGITRAIASLTTLKRLSLVDPDTSTMHLLLGMHSSLSYLAIRGAYPAKLPLLPAGGEFSPLRSLRTLQLHSVERPLESSWWLEHCPNLEDIYLLSSATDHPANVAHSLRQKNRAAIQASAARGWPSLKLCGGSIHDVYSLGLSHRLDSLMLVHSSGWNSDGLSEMLRAVLCDTMPKTLRIFLHITEDGLACRDEDERQRRESAPVRAIRRALEGPGSGRLHELRVVVTFKFRYHSLGLDVLDTVVDTLPLCDIKVLKLKLVHNSGDGTLLRQFFHEAMTPPPGKVMVTRDTNNRPLVLSGDRREELSRTSFQKGAGLQEVDVVVRACNACEETLPGVAPIAEEFWCSCEGRSVRRDEVMDI